MLTVLTDLRDTLITALLSPASLVSIWSLGAAFLVAAGVVLAQRRSRRTRFGALVRVMLPRRLFVSPSGRADLAFTAFGVLLSGALLGWAIVSHALIADTVAGALGSVWRPAATLPDWLAVAIVTAALWIAYEFAYFWNHMLAHRWNWLWAFHKVHHSAETLTPLTIWRVHPVDSIVFYNFVAVVTGVVGGLARWSLGDGVAPATLFGANVIALAALLTVKHLHHSHAWIAFTGMLGRVVLSPAHHQIHHSRSPEHHDRNFGDMLGIFDWLCGTLVMPTRTRQPLVFGVDGLAAPHTPHGALIEPFVDALAPLRARGFLVHGGKPT